MSRTGMAGTHIRLLAFRQAAFGLGALGAGMLLLLGGAMAQTAGTVVMQPLPAQDSALEITPARPSNLHILSASDHDLYTQAFAAAAKGDWTTALTLGNQGQDSLARQLLQ